MITSQRELDEELKELREGKEKDYELGLEMGRKIGISQGKQEAKKELLIWIENNFPHSCEDINECNICKIYKYIEEKP